MSRLCQIFILLCFTLNISAQDGITFKVEDLSKPDKLLLNRQVDDIYKILILNDIGLDRWDIEQINMNNSYNILARSEGGDSLVNYDYHSFFQGMYEAYAHHRPFVLSPDMIWLLISQGFARHVHANPEKLRDYFTESPDKLTLMIESNESLLDRPDYNWGSLFPQFTRQIAEHTGKELIELLSADFSTTTEVEKIATEITVMKAMEPYFEFVVFNVICGIPEITLQGTTADWQKILDKTQRLGKYDLTWWTKSLEPLLVEFRNASQGKIDKKFWRNMFKAHSQKKYGAPEIIDGWIVRFFPYDKDGKRNNLKILKGGDNLPEEIVKVDLKYLEIGFGNKTETELELWAGFVGLEQNPETYALAPKIGWMIRKKDIDLKGLQQKLENNNIPDSQVTSGLNLRINEVPEYLKMLDEIYNIRLNFTGPVFIPEWLKNIRIGILNINGAITEAEKRKIIQWFPSSDVVINRTVYNRGNNEWISVIDVIPESVLKMNKIWVLEFWGGFTEPEISFPEALKNIEIDNISIAYSISDDNIKKLQKIMPKTKIFINGKRIQ